MKKLKYARIVAGKTMRESAFLLGVTEGPIVRWECGATSPSLDQAVALAAFYGCPLVDLVGDVPPGTSIPIEALSRMRGPRPPAA